MGQRQWNTLPNICKNLCIPLRFLKAFPSELNPIPTATGRTHDANVIKILFINPCVKMQIISVVTMNTTNTIIKAIISFLFFV